MIAERITKRFFNVIQILSGSAPLIAIQANIVKSPAGHSLHFTKVLDVYEEADDETGQDSGRYDEAFWASKSNDTLRVAKRISEITNPVYESARLSYCKNSINFVRDSYNQMLVRVRSGGNIMVVFRYGSRRDEIAQLLESRSIQYSDKNRHFKFIMNVERACKEDELFTEFAKSNKQWWTESDNGD